MFCLAAVYVGEAFCHSERSEESLLGYVVLWSVEVCDASSAWRLPQHDKNGMWDEIVMKEYFVYIMTNRSGTLYIGVTNNLQRRIYEHKRKLVLDFTSKYNINRLIYFESTSDILEAISREKQLKGWTRKKKLDLIRTTNPTFAELSEDWYC